MKKKNTIFIFSILLAGFTVSAQESTTTSGGTASGTGGTASYSVGQVVYTSITGTNGSITQGVQQSFQISTIINETDNKLELAVYPNPTADYLTLKVENAGHLNYQLFDLNCRLIENKKIIQEKSSINMEALPASTYFLKITKDHQLVKTFKIVKN